MEQRHGAHPKEVIDGVPVAENDAGFQFSRLFPNLTAFNITPDAALALGSAMTRDATDADGLPLSRRDSDIPAGYTYFGQFIDHDITRDQTGDEDALDDIPASMKRLQQTRSPTLDLDSVYGTVSPNSKGGESPRNGPFFTFARTKAENFGVPRSGESFDLDLHRTDDSRVCIPDDRNDENLIVAQMHLAWMKFHNAVVRVLKNDDFTVSDEQVFEDARRLVTQHYQHIVLFDFLERISDPKVHKDVIVDGNCSVCDTTVAEAINMPLEFAAAAFRFAHTMIRQEYDWNANFKNNGGVLAPAANFSRATPQPSLSLFTFTNRFLTKSDPLPSTWVADWRRLLDFSGTGINVGDVAPTPTAALDPYLAPGMGNLPRGSDAPQSVIANLAASNIRRGALRGLPSGQDVSRAMNKVKMLTKTEMKANLDPVLTELVDRLQLDEKAPLWFYILQEANALGDGKRLGRMGSILVCETIVALVKASKPSIITKPWTPAESSLRLRNGSEVNTLQSVFAFCEENGFPIINPLQAD